MFVWWSITLIGCLCVGTIHCQENIPELADIEPRQDDNLQAELFGDDSLLQQANDTNNFAKTRVIVTRIISTTTQTSKPFSCHECTNCKSKSDFTTRICETGITMCYKMDKRIDNTTRIIYRGCSTSKAQCTVPDTDPTGSFNSITCCTSHKCNQATQFKPLFFLSTLSLFTNIIKI